MSDPKLTRVRVMLTYSSDDGFTREVSYNSRVQKASAVDTLLAAISEATRIAASFGYGGAALEVAKEATDRVAEWQEQHEKDTQ